MISALIWVDVGTRDRNYGLRKTAPLGKQGRQAPSLLRLLFGSPHLRDVDS